MKVRLLVASLFFAFSLETYSCDLPPKKKKKLISSVPYHVENIVCNEKGQYLWTITNAIYMKPHKKVAEVKKNKVKKNERKLASIKPQMTDHEKAPQSFSVGLSSSTASIASKDTTTGTTEKAVSDLGIGVSASWSHHWSERFHYFVVASLKKFNFEMGTSRTLEGASATQSYIGTGLNIKLSDRISLTPGLGIGESFILSSTGGTSFKIDKATTPTASLSSHIDLVRFNSGYSLFTTLRLGAMMPTSQAGYDTEFGHYQSISLGSRFGMWGNSTMSINTNYTQRELEIGTAEQTSKDLGISIGLGWEF